MCFIFVNMNGHPLVPDLSILVTLLRDAEQITQRHMINTSRGQKAEMT